MIWKINFGDRDWHSWFAWYPVRLSFDQNDSRVWWEWIERKKENIQGYIITSYRLPNGFRRMKETKE